MTEMVKNWQHLCQKLAVVVALDDFIGLAPDVIVEELTGDNTVRKLDRCDIKGHGKKSMTIMETSLLLEKHPAWHKVFGAS